jgi:hypothetical protein
MPQNQDYTYKSSGTNSQVSPTISTSDMAPTKTHI